MVQGRWMRIPGPSLGLPINSMPAASRVVWIAEIVATVVGGIPKVASIRRTVLDAIPACCAKVSALQLRALLAALIWTPIIIDTLSMSII